MGFLAAVLIVVAIFFSYSCKSVSQIIAEKDYTKIEDKDLQALAICGQVFGRENSVAATALCTNVGDNYTEEKRENRKRGRYKFCKDIHDEAIKNNERPIEALRIQTDCWKSMNEK